MRMRPFGLALVSLVASTWMLGGCGDSDDARKRVSVDPDLDPPAGVFATYKSTGASAQARGSGTLAVSNGCLVLRNGGHNQLIVLNDRTTLDGETLHVVDAFGQTADMKLGDTVAFGGGYHEGLLPSGTAATVPEACSEAAKDGAFFAGTIDQP